MTEQTDPQPGFQIRVLRKTRRQSIEAVAIEAGITYKTLSDIERGVTRQPAREVLQQIPEALHRVAPLRVEEQRDIIPVTTPSFALRVGNLA